MDCWSGPPTARTPRESFSGIGGSRDVVAVPTVEPGTETAEETNLVRPWFKRVGAVGLVAVALLVGVATWKGTCRTISADTNENVQLDAKTRMEVMANKLNKITSKSAAENLVHRAMEIGSEEVMEKWEATKGHHAPTLEEMMKESHDAAAPERKLSAPPRQLPNSFIGVLNQDPESGVKQGTAQCIFDVLQAMTLAIGLGDDINGMAATCPEKRDVPAEVACQVDSGLLVAYVGTLASKLSLAASSCAETANIDAVCSGGITGLVGVLGELAATAALAAPSCMTKTQETSGANLGLPTTQISQLGVHRRLMNQTTVDGRRLVIGEGTIGNGIQCGVDVSMVAENLADFGLAINEAAESGMCDSSYWGVGQNLGSLTRSVCTVDIAGAIAYFAQSVTFINLAVVNCADFLDVKALCGAAISGIATSAAGIAAYGAAIEAGCAEGPSNLAKAATGGRRLKAEDPFEKLGNVTAKLRKTMDRMGYDSSQVKSGHDQVKVPMKDADIKKLLDLAEPAVKEKSFRGSWASPVCK